jgi:hypothetical protein
MLMATPSQVPTAPEMAAGPYSGLAVPTAAATVGAQSTVAVIACTAVVIVIIVIFIDIIIVVDFCSMKLLVCVYIYKYLPFKRFPRAATRDYI